MILLAPGGPAARLNPQGYAGVSPASVQIAAAVAAAHLTRDERAPPDPSRSPRTMVFATREEEIDYLRDELRGVRYLASFERCRVWWPVSAC